MKRVGEELADIIAYCLSLANTLGLDVAYTVSRKLARNREKYPVSQYQVQI